jgi:hypothetical protein
LLLKPPDWWVRTRLTRPLKNKVLSDELAQRNKGRLLTNSQPWWSGQRLADSSVLILHVRRNCSNSTNISVYYK